jgi:hypothetical protein
MHDVSVTPFHAFRVLILPFWLYICILDHNVSKPGLEPQAWASEIWSQARAHCKPLSGPGWAWAWTGSARRAQGLRPGPAHHYRGLSCASVFVMSYLSVWTPLVNYWRRFWPWNYACWFHMGGPSFRWNQRNVCTSLNVGTNSQGHQLGS